MKRVIIILLGCVGLFALIVGCDKKQSIEKQNIKKVKLAWGHVGRLPEEPQLNPYELTRNDKTLDVASVLYAIRRDFKTTEQIARETGIAPERIEQKMQQLEACDLVRRTADGFIVDFPFWDQPLRDALDDLGLELAYKMTRIVKYELMGLKLIFERSTLVDQGFSWDDVATAIVGGFLLDVGVNDRGVRQAEIFVPERDTPQRPGGYRYWYRAIEDDWDDLWNFGHDMIFNEDRDLGLGMFYGGENGQKTGRPVCWDIFKPYIQPIIFPLIKTGKLTVDQLQEQSGIPRDSLQAILQRMAEVKIVRFEDDGVRPGFPVFNEPDFENILFIIDRACRHIVINAHVPLLPLIEGRWEEIAPANWEIKNVDKFFINEVHRRAYHLTLDMLIGERSLPPPATEPPFDYWGINGDFESLLEQNR